MSVSTFLLDVQTSDSAQALGSRERSTAGTSAVQMHIPDHMIQVPRRLKAQNSDIVWSGVAWICSKQLKHYPAFSRNEIIITVHSFVLVMAEEESHYVGYLEDLYEDKKGQKKVKVRWFHHNREVKDLIPQLKPHPREVFITPHVQAVSAECIDGPAIVLTPKHFEKCLAIASHALSAGIHMCFRQFKNNKVKPFSLSKLRGYSNQAILSSLGCPVGPKHRTKGHKSNGEEDEDFTHEGRGAKRNRSSRGNQRLEAGNSGATNSIPGKEMIKSQPTYKKLRIKLSNRELSSFKLVGPPQPPIRASFKVDEKIELLCQDSGIRGCWFRCKVLQASQKRLKVQYVDVEDAEGSGNLEEWVPASIVAAPDKLGLRCLGRLTVRPWPSEDSSNGSVEVGASVDAWWSDGWWEGVVTGVDESGNDSLQVYFPGEDRCLTLQRKNIRTSRDWIANRWVNIKAKPDILSYVSSINSPTMKFPKCTSKLEPIEEVKQKLSSSAASNDQEIMEGVEMKRLCINDEGKVDEGGDCGGDGVGKEAKLVLDLEPANRKCEIEEMEVVP